MGLKLLPGGLRKVTSVRWDPPPPCYIKAISDGSATNGLIEGGSVFRNCMGFVEARGGTRILGGGGPINIDQY